MTQDLYIITGASRGMGEAIAGQLLRPGHLVIGEDEAELPVWRLIAHQDHVGTEPLARTPGACHVSSPVCGRAIW